MEKLSRTLINVDLSQAELRVMAILSGDRWMQDALQEGAGDFFDNHLMPVAFPWILDDYTSVEAYKETNPVEHKENRTKVKAVQYGLAFGRQAPAIARSLGMSTHSAQNIIDNYLSTATSFAEWRLDIMEAARVPSKRALLTNPFGRKFQSEVVTTKNYHNIQREALSFLPQSTSSDIMLATCVRINQPLKDWGYHIFNIVHDAVMIEGPQQDAWKVGTFVGQELRKTGEMVMGKDVPFLSDFSMGKSWADLS